MFLLNPDRAQEASLLLGLQTRISPPSASTVSTLDPVPTAKSFETERFKKITRNVAIARMDFALFQQLPEAHQ